MIYDRLIYRTTREILKEEFPFAFQTPQNLQMLIFLMFGQKDEDTGNVIASHEFLFGLNNPRGLKSSHNFSSGKFLEWYLQKLGVGYKIKNHNYFQGKARTIQIDWPGPVVEVMRNDLHRIFGRQGLVYFLSGKPYNEKYHREKILGHLQPVPYDQSRLNAQIMGYMAQNRFRDYYRYASNLEYARYTMLNGPFKRKSIPGQLEVLHQMDFCMKPFYKQVATTDRIFTDVLSLQNLNKNLRRIVLDDCMMADLKSCHLSIVAYDWGIPELQDFLESGQSFWKLLIKDFGLPDTDKEKGHLKKALYAIVYGAKEPKVKAQLLSWQKPDKTKFCQHPMIQLILERREEVLQQIEKDGGLRILDTFHPIQPNVTSKSLLARKSQAIETYVIKGAYEYAQENSDLIRIISHEHDGFSAQLKGLSQKERAEVKKGINERVESRAAEMGVKLTMEYELPEESVTSRAM